MRPTPTPLLCELHAHSTWSDGDLSLSELVDLYGGEGFDVLCVTDHVGRSEWSDPRWRITGAESFDEYVAEIEREAWRAQCEYDLLVLPGLELTYDDEDPLRAAHAVAIGLRQLVTLDQGLETALVDARAAGAALIAAHPYPPGGLETSPAKPAPSGQTTVVCRRTWRWAAAGQSLSPLVDRYELANRRDVFPWVSEAGLPAVASGDFHRQEHLLTWKTLLPCAPSEHAVVRYLRSNLPAYLVDLGERGRLRAAA
jgi:hypothetical protein